MIKCPYCGKLENTNLYTANTRDGRVRRRRKCEGCGRKFTTYEVLRETIKEKGDGAFVRLKKGRIPEDERDDRCRDQDSGEDSWPFVDSWIGTDDRSEAMSAKEYRDVYDHMTDTEKDLMYDLYMTGINHDGHSWVTYGDVEKTVGLIIKERLNETD